MSVVWSSYDYLLLEGTADQAQRTFAVRMRRFRLPAGSSFYAADRAPLVPGYVSVVLGLNELERFRPAQLGQDLCAPGTACLGGVTPRDLWSVYGLPGSGGGHGQRVGVLGQGAWTSAIQDLRLFEAKQKLPKVNVRVVAVNDPNTDTTNQTEWDIDTQASTGMAPGVDELVLYFASSLAGTDMTAAMSAWANDPLGPNQVDASFGGCESLNLVLNNIGAEEPVFRQAAAEGRTLFAATGDTGGSCTLITGNGVINTGAPQVSWPASSAHVTAVGGTQLYTDGASPAKRTIEKAWEYTGGGTSYLVPAPDWQRKIAVVAGRCTVSMDGSPAPPNTVCRGLPDVAALSGDIATNGYKIVAAGKDASGGGTSLSSPLWAGMWARIQASAPLESGRVVSLGFASPLLYGRAFGQGTESLDFYDITVGGNGQYVAIPANPADPTGWDYVSGLGAPIVRNLMRHLTHRTTDAISRGAPSQPDRVMGPSKLSCRPDASLTDPTGDVFGPFKGDADTSGLHLIPGKATATFVLKLPGLADNPDVVLHTMHFRYDGVDYDVQGERLPPGSFPAFFLDKYVAGTSTNLGNLTGVFDLVAHELRIVLDARTFNGLAHPNHDLKSGSVIEIGSVMTTVNVFTDDTMISPNCPYRLR